MTDDAWEDGPKTAAGVNRLVEEESEAERGRMAGESLDAGQQPQEPVCKVPSSRRRRAETGCQQGQVGHRRRQAHLEQCLGPADVARLANAQLDQPREAMLHHLPPAAKLSKCETLLEGAGLLEQGFLRV